jgi:hypothetical protein
MMALGNKKRLDGHLHMCSKECAEAEKQERSDAATPTAVDHCFGPGACMWTEGSCSDEVPFCR